MIAISGCGVDTVGAGVPSGGASLSAFTVTGEGPCAGATPVGFVTHSDLLIWTCNDGRLIVSPRAEPMRVLREIRDVIPMLSYWIERHGDGVSLVKFHSPEPGDYALKVADLTTGVMSRRVITPVGSDVIEAVEANPAAGCLMVVSVDPRQFEQVVRLHSYPRHVRIYPYRPGETTAIDLSHATAELDVDLHETVTNGVSAIGSSLRCTRNAQGRAVIYASSIREARPDPDRPYTLTRITVSGSVVVARAASNIFMVSPRDGHLLGALDQDTGNAWRIDPDQDFAEIVPARAGWRWVSFDPRTRSGLQARPHGSARGEVELSLVPAAPGQSATLLGDGQTFYDITVSPDPGAFMAALDVRGVVENDRTREISGDHIIWIEGQ